VLGLASSVVTAATAHVAVFLLQHLPPELPAQPSSPSHGSPRSPGELHVLPALPRPARDLLASAAVIWVAGISLSKYTDVLAERLHLGAALGG